jgi:hypothetical protein
MLPYPARGGAGQGETANRICSQQSKVSRFARSGCASNWLFVLFGEEDLHEWISSFSTPHPPQ